MRVGNEIRKLFWCPKGNNTANVVVQLEWVSNKVMKLSKNLNEFMAKTSHKYVEII